MSDAPAYGAAARFFHRLGLGSRAVMETSFDMEQAMFGRQAAAMPVDRPIFVCGLARAGTSLVTRLLEDSGLFAAALYRDMPFPLAPNLWGRIGGRRQVAATERGHGDGLLHDLDTPEAIEEVFWRCFEGDRYQQDAGLAPVPPERETLSAFRRYVASVQLARGRPRYLSKNNNNVLRLAALADAFPDAVFVHPFRNPLEQAESLRAQHVRALALHQADPFRRDYMRWLGHHEFGADQKPFLFSGAPDASGDREGLEYWLLAWGSVHARLLDQPDSVRDRQIFLDYDQLRANPGAAAGLIERIAGAPLGVREAIRGRDYPEAQVDRARAGAQAGVYDALTARAAADAVARSVAG